MNPATPLSRLFPGTSYRLAMNLRPLNAEEFFTPRSGGGILRQRATLLGNAPEFYLAALPEADTGIELLSRFLQPWTGLEHASLRDIGAALEPDLVLMQRADFGAWRVMAGCVCFPTMWSLPEKLGGSLFATHAAVPGLNAQLGARVDQFLDRVSKAGVFGRENWGLTATDALDQHPRHHLPEIAADASLDRAWLRVEDQAFVGLGDGWVLFGIRVSHHRLDTLAQDRPLAAQLALALETMPETLAEYKRLTHCRAALIAKLREEPTAPASLPK